MQSLWMIVYGFLSAGMGVCVKWSAEAGYGQGEIVFYRSLVALTMMGALVRWRGVRLATPHWRWQLKRGLTGFCSFTTYFYAISLLPLTTAVTLNFTSPIFLVLLFVLFRGLKPSFGICLSLGLGLLGVVLLLHPTMSADMGPGLAVAMLSALLAAGTWFDVKKLGELGEPVARTVFYFSVLATVLSFLWFCLTPRHPLTWLGFASLIGVGVFSTLAQLAMTRAYARGKMLLNASLAYTTVAFSSLFGLLWWHDPLDRLELLGMGLIVVSGIAANHFGRRKPRPPTSLTPRQ